MSEEKMEAEKKVCGKGNNCSEHTSRGDKMKEEPTQIGMYITQELKNAFILSWANQNPKTRAKSWQEHIRQVLRNYIVSEIQDGKNQE